MSGKRSITSITDVVGAHRWSIVSLTLSFMLVLIDNIVMGYLRTSGVYGGPYSLFANRFVAALAWGMLTSAVLAVVALIKEPRPWPSLAALGVAGFVLFAWGATA